LRRLITPLFGVFDQTFFEKVCVTPVDHAVTSFLIKLFVKKFVGEPSLIEREIIELSFL
jgi:hypothetical protein